MWAKCVLGAFALLFGASGFLHLVQPAPFVKIVPPLLPHPRALVAISGVAELLGAAGLLVAPVRRVAAWGLTALLLAVFPANIYMAVGRVQVTETAPPEWVLWARLPLQALFVFGVLWSTSQLGTKRPST